IAGIINQKRDPVVDSELRQMTNLVSHRGPDGQGFYSYKNLGFGHRRLSILDLSDAGHQPMELDNDYVITYNGEVYNYIELRNELKKLGHHFSTQTDTEVILASYREWGTACVSRFNGMWAFAIHDTKKQIVFCSRDRFGVKPFYYTVTGNKFLFGSEIKQFSEFKSNWNANKSILMDYLIFNLIDHKNECFFDGVYKLPGSHNLIYDLETDKFEIKKYYSISLNNDITRLNETESLEAFKTEINRSVDWRLRSDVKVGSSLSGGLDSSYISALAGNKYNYGHERFSAVTVQSIDTAQDESPFAGKVVDANNFRWLITTPTAADFSSSLDDVIYNQDEPFINPSVFMQYFVMKKAREGGITVLLDGQGADEILMGYPRYLGAYFKSLPANQLLANIYRSQNQYGVSAWSILKYYLYFTSFSVRYKRNMWNFSDISKKYSGMVDPKMIRNLVNSSKDIKELQQLEISSTILPSLLRYEDKNSMSCSVESRLPYLDWNFVELALSINGQFKIKDGWSKYILRKSMQGLLPDDITWRKKKFGYNPPSTLWFDGIPNMDFLISKSAILNEIFDGKIPEYRDPNIKWRLLNISKWEKIYNVTMSN
ncbi:MAG TPA: asparagine synthase (glutamine-hydrolyzing), partial [Mucilaginibacter sp.]|nr:asparagine synthase (glutamine-hydrolyzing) [Mucilaginibacter sp.]